jgi:FMN-dependent NADH-azoreductase
MTIVQQAMTAPLRVLRVDASGRHSGSTTRKLTDAFIDALRARAPAMQLTVRDVAQGLPFVDQAWIEANFTPVEDRTPEQQALLAGSDALAQELVDADVLVIGVPLYNFGIPAALKAWIDMVARARVTFRYTDSGPEGLLQGKKAWLIAASGGVTVGSAIDFATRYLRHVLAFLGITDVEVIAAERQMQQGDRALAYAQAQIGAAVDTAVQHRAAA